MNCPTCNRPMTTLKSSSFEMIDGKKWVYEFEEMGCAIHTDDTFQTSAQLDGEIEAVRKNRETARALKKATFS